MPTLVLSIGILVLLSVGSVLIVNWMADRRIVQEFTSRLITRVLSAEERSLREHLDAAIDQGDFIAAAISSGRYQLAEPALTDLLAELLRQLPKSTEWSSAMARERRYASSAVHQTQRFRSTISMLPETASSPRSPLKFAPANTPIGDRRFIARKGRRPS